MAAIAALVTLSLEEDVDETEGVGVLAVAVPVSCGESGLNSASTMDNALLLLRKALRGETMGGLPVPKAQATVIGRHPGNRPGYTPGNDSTMHFRTEPELYSWLTI
jgi:hypothetical protein